MKFYKRFLVLPAIMAIFSSALLAQETEEDYFSQAELDQMLAPIALYPDVLLSQVLIAATYPLEVVEASRWSQANPELEGDEAVRSVEDMGWDPSVKTLVGFPDLIKLMDENLTWTRRLGDAFLIQEEQVMETIQNLRSKALETGNLASLEHVTVEQNEREIIIEPARVEVVYVPYYSTRIVYGDWWWPNYPPVYWYVRPAYYSSVGFSWSRGFRVSTSFYYSSCDWRRRNIIIYHNHRDRDRYDFRHVRDRRRVDDRQARIWRHEPIHRKGVHYRSQELNNRYDRKRVATSSREKFTERTRPAERTRTPDRTRPSERTRPAERAQLPERRTAEQRDRDLRKNIPDRVAQWEGRYRKDARPETEERTQSPRTGDRVSTPDRTVRRDDRVGRDQPKSDERVRQPRESVKPPPSRQPPPPETVRATPPVYSQADTSRGSDSQPRYTNRRVPDNNRFRETRERSPKARIKRDMD